MKLLFLVLCFVTFSLEAAQFQTSTQITPVEQTGEKDSKQYLVEVQIKKIEQEQSKSEIIASPKFYCESTAHFLSKSEDNSDLISIFVDVSDTSYISISVKENNEIIFQDFSIVELN